MMLLLAQIPDPTQVVTAATEVSWVAGLLTVLVLGCFVVFIWMLRHETARHSKIEERNLQDAREREVRLANRITTLEDSLRVELIQLVRTNTDMMARMVSAADSICNAADKMMEALKQFMVLMNSGACPLADPARIKLWEDFQKERARADRDDP